MNETAMTRRNGASDTVTGIGEWLSRAWRRAGAVVQGVARAARATIAVLRGKPVALRDAALGFRTASGVIRASMSVLRAMLLFLRAFMRVLRGVATAGRAISAIVQRFARMLRGLAAPLRPRVPEWPMLMG